MSTIPQSGSTGDDNHHKVAISMTILVVLIVIIIVAAWFTNRIRPPVIIPASVRNQRRREEERYQKETRRFLLESLPVMRYSMRLLPNEQRHSEVRGSARNTYSPRRQLQSTTKGDEPRAIHNEVAVMGCANRHRAEMVPSPDKLDAKLGKPEDELLQNGVQSESSIDRSSCSICTENFTENENIRILLCGHIYHRHCIDPWLIDFGGTCPLW